MPSNDLLLRLSPKTDQPLTEDQLNNLLLQLRALVEHFGFQLLQHGNLDAMIQSLKDEQAFVSRLTDPSTDPSAAS